MGRLAHGGTAGEGPVFLSRRKLLPHAGAALADSPSTPGPDLPLHVQSGDGESSGADQHSDRDSDGSDGSNDSDTSDDDDRRGGGLGAASSFVGYRALFGSSTSDTATPT